MSEILAFTPEQVCRLTGLTPRQLSYWDKSGFFPPTYTADTPRGSLSRAYSFRDVVGLRTLAQLRKQYKVPLQELRKVGALLVERYDQPWSSLVFYVDGQRVFFDHPASGVPLAGRPADQPVFPVSMERIERETREAAARLRDRTPEELGRIEHHRHILRNTPRLAGTRIPTSAIWNFHEAGYDTDAILREYPRLTATDVEAAIEYERRQRSQRKGERTARAGAG